MATYRADGLHCLRKFRKRTQISNHAERISEKELYVSECKNKVVHLGGNDSWSGKSLPGNSTMIFVFYTVAKNKKEI